MGTKVKAILYLLIFVSVSFISISSVAAQSAEGGGSMIQVKGNIVDKLDGTFSGTFQSTPVGDVFRIISGETGMNIMVSQRINQTITAKFKDVPIRDVFLAVLSANDLYYVEQGNIVKIVTVQEYRSEMQRNFLTTRTYDASIMDIKNLTSVLKPLLTPGIGDFSVDAASSKIIVTDIKDNFNRIDKLFSDISELPYMVEIETKIIEITLDEGNEYGINWSAMNIGISGNNGTGNFFISPGVVSKEKQTLSLNAHYLEPNNQISFDTFINALSTKYKTKLVSSPKVLAINRGEARIHIGKSVPYIKSSSVNQTTSYVTSDVAFIDTGVNLKVTPYITPNGEVKMTINADLSSYTIQDLVGNSSNNTQQAPLLTKSEVTGDTLAKDGQIIIIGGLISTTDVKNIDAVPILGYIPIIGFLFSHTTITTEREELVILLTPHIIKGGQSNIALGRNSQEILDAATNSGVDNPATNFSGINPAPASPAHSTQTNIQATGSIIR